MVQAGCKQAGGPSVRVELDDGQGSVEERGIKILALVFLPPPEPLRKSIDALGSEPSVQGGARLTDGACKQER